MARDLKILNPGVSINQKKITPDMANTEGKFDGMYMNHKAKNNDEWAEEKK